MLMLISFCVCTACYDRLKILKAMLRNVVHQLVKLQLISNALNRIDIQHISATRGTNGLNLFFDLFCHVIPFIKLINICSGLGILRSSPLTYAKPPKPSAELPGVNKLAEHFLQLIRGDDKEHLGMPLEVLPDTGF